MARDTRILAESGYQNVVEFAKAEYGIDKTQVSRFMNINDKFSEGGYAPELKAEYQGFGYAKLSIMLSPPDEVNEVLTPDLSKSEIQQLKEDVDEEKKTTDIEVMLEEKDSVQEALDTNLEKTMYQLGKDAPEIYKNCGLRLLRMERQENTSLRTSYRMNKLSTQSVFREQVHICLRSQKTVMK